MRIAKHSDSLEQSKHYAEIAGLNYVVPSLNPDTPKTLGYARVRHGKSPKSFQYRTHRGAIVKNAKTLERIRKLAIPPAYENVWIAVDPDAHLQVVGEDARGRKQYRYHPKWLAIKAKTKYSRMLEFARILPNIRKVTDRHLRQKELNREKVLATLVRLLEKTLIRIGNDEYAKSNHSYGLSTLKHEHVHLENGKIIFRFRGKSKVRHEITLKDKKIAKVIEACRALKGRELFRYADESGKLRRIHAQDVNHYLHEITGKTLEKKSKNPAITAKDFRTWGATLFAASVFHQTPASVGKGKINQSVNEVIDQVAHKLGNTRSICRKSYIHPSIIDAFITRKSILKEPISDLENQVVSFLKRYHAEPN
jgi:DNA topoisomerase-1